MRPANTRRITAVAAIGLASFVALGGMVVAPHKALAAGLPYTNTFAYGDPAAPQSIVPADLDVQIHRRDPDNSMEPMDAGHGTDCSAPPAVHPINTLAQGVFNCRNHLMTSIGDSGYGEIALTADHMADWSSGTTTITVQVSTQQFNTSDWIEVWITPFTDNQTLPFEPDIIDFQGPAHNALVFSLNSSALLGTYSGDVTPIENFVVMNSLTKIACTFQYDPTCVNNLGHTSVVPASAVTRVTYEIDISTSHIKFGLPGFVTWTDANYAPKFTQGIVQLVHHSYNPLKHDPGTGIDTFHWSNLSISNAIPFTIINGNERSINATDGTVVHFPRPAPTGSYLRFSGLGPPATTFKVSYDGGTTWALPASQPVAVNHDEHFRTYFTPIPTGTQVVMFRGQDWWGGPWWARDPAIWSLSTAPLSPSAVGAIAGDGSATVSWTPPSWSGTSPVTSYVVTAHDGCTIQGSITVSATATSATFNGLSNGTAYTFTVAAVNSNGIGPDSAASNGIVPSGPTAPSWLSACSTKQYTLAGNDGSTWTDLDPTNLSVSFTPAVSSYALVTGNIDLWTANAGYNQDVAISVNGSVAAWKESGGFAGTFSPNAATVQTVVPVNASTPYAIKLQWKSHKPDPGSIFAGAGPIAGAFSPTRLTVQLIPVSSSRIFTVSSTSQHALTNSDGVTWQDIDPNQLSLQFSLPSTGTWMAYAFGNADLWTSSAGYNQDLGVNISGGAYPTVANQPEAWKESGGFAGTFSPNAAFVQAPLTALSAGTTYTAKLQWKAHRADSGSIFIGAGPLAGHYSPTTLTVVLAAQTSAVANSRNQYSSDGASWQSMDATNLKWSLSPSADTDYKISAGSDLWTAVAGFNQDIGIMASGGAYGSGTLVAWKESGGSAGTFSPNAAFATVDLHLQAGNTYNVWVVWKANHSAATSNAIWAGAGPINGNFSPTTLTALQLA